MPIVKRSFSNPLVLFLIGLLSILIPFSLRWIGSGWLAALIMAAQLGLVSGVIYTVEGRAATPFGLGGLCGLLAVTGWYASGHSLTSAYSHWLPAWSMAHLLIISLIRRKRAG